MGLELPKPLLKVLLLLLRVLALFADERGESANSRVDLARAAVVQDPAEFENATQVVGAVEVGGRVGDAGPAGGRVAVDVARVAVAADGDEGVEVAVVGCEKLEVGTGGPGEEGEAEAGLVGVSDLETTGWVK